MNRITTIKSVAFTCLAISLGLALAPCHGFAATTMPASGPQADAAGPVIEVVGNEALTDLGTVAPGSRHVVVFVVRNEADQPLVFKTVQGECECISAIDAPDHIAAKGSVRISVSYVAPKIAMEYETRLLIATDNPSRRLISLRVKSAPPKP